MYNRIINYFSDRLKFNILGIITTEKNYKFVDGFLCITPCDIKSHSFDYIIIAIDNWKEPYRLLKGLGIEDEKIIRGGVSLW